MGRRVLSVKVEVICQVRCFSDWSDVCHSVGTLTTNTLDLDLLHGDKTLFKMIIYHSVFNTAFTVTHGQRGSSSWTAVYGYTTTTNHIHSPTRWQFVRTRKIISFDLRFSYFQPFNFFFSTFRAKELHVEYKPKIFCKNLCCGECPVIK